jgi:hypothetical protein
MIGIQYWSWLLQPFGFKLQESHIGSAQPIPKRPIDSEHSQYKKKNKGIEKGVQKQTHSNHDFIWWKMNYQGQQTKHSTTVYNNFTKKNINIEN